MPLVLECVEEIDQVFLLLVRETEVKSLVVEVHRVEQGGCRAVVEIGRACGQSPQNKSLEPADVLAPSRNQRAAGSVTTKVCPKSGFPTCVHSRVKTGNPEMSRAGGLFFPASAMPMFKGALTE